MMHQETVDYTAQSLDGSQPFDALTQPIADSFQMSAQNSKQDENFSSQSTPSPSPPSGTEQRGAGRQRSKSGTGHLTMQQLNKKRQRATADQLIVLEEAFHVNASPNAKMREMISERIKMTERSVQIWFQNRRAKVKQMQSKEKRDENVFYTGINGSPGMMMDHMKRNALMRSNSVGHGGGYSALSADIRYGLGMGFNGPLTPAASPSSTSVVARLEIETLSIGTWHRVACSSMDLMCFFSPMEGRFTYYINNSATGFKIEYPVHSIVGIKVEHMVRTDAMSGNGQPLREEAKHRARIMIELTQSPLFFSETRGVGGWQHCHDFTQGSVASRILLHTLVGPYDRLIQELQKVAALSPDLAARLVMDDQPQYLSFDDDERTVGTQADRNRRHSATAMPAPPRPASAMPSQFARQHLTPGPVPPFNASLQGPRVRQSFQAHRRTRSRSLPTAVNVSDLALAASQHIGSNVVPGMKFGQEVNHYMSFNHDMLYSQQTPLRIDTSVADSFEYYRAFTPSSNMSSLTPVDYMSSPASQVPLPSALPFYEGNQYEQINPNGYAHSALYSTDNVDAPTIYTEEVSQPGMMNLDQYPQESFTYTPDPNTLQDNYTAVTDQQWHTPTPQVTVTSQMDGVEDKEMEPMVTKDDDTGEAKMELAE